MITWYNEQDLPYVELIKPIIDYVAKEEKITARLIYDVWDKAPGTFVSPAQGNAKKPDIVIPNGGSMNEVFASNDGLSTLSRMRVSVIKGSELPHEMKEFLVILTDILHEMGHVKYQYNNRGRSLNDMERYWSDLEYRLHVEDEAEQLVTKWFKHFGFYKFINDLLAFE